MSYDFWVDINAAGDLGSGCTQDLTPAWSGTVNISGTAVTAVTGGNFPTALFDGKHFLRVDPDGAGDANIRIASGGVGELTLAESGGTRTGVAASIGGAFKSPEKAVGTAAVASKIPYGSDAVLDAIDIWIKSGTYALTAPLVIESATQDTNKYRRRIRGYNGGFNYGVFSGPTLSFSGTGVDAKVITVNAHGIVIDGLKIIGNAFKTGIYLSTGKYNLVVDNCDLSSGGTGFFGSDGSCSNIIESRFNGFLTSGVRGANSSVLRCVSDGCANAWQGTMSSYIACDEKNTVSSLIKIDAYPGSLDFSFCLFESNKPILIEEEAWGSQIVFSHTIFNHALNLAEVYGDINFENCPMNGDLTEQDYKVWNAVPRFNTVRRATGIDTYTSVYTDALNFETNYPDPVLDKYCRYTTAGPHEYRFPVEAVGARALRNRQRVTNSEIGL